VLATRTTAEWLELLEAAGVPCGPLNDVAALLRDPQIAARNMLVTVLDSAAGEVRLAGNPVKLSGFADPSARGAVPDLDADRERILAELAADAS
jgi:CoA:oxalate CoA-transferase